MILHPLTLEIMVFELTLELNLGSAEAVEIENTLFQNGRLSPPISIIHPWYIL
jgi:hypothetical protein